MTFLILRGYQRDSSHFHYDDLLVERHELVASYSYFHQIVWKLHHLNGITCILDVHLDKSWQMELFNSSELSIFLANELSSDVWMIRRLTTWLIQCLAHRVATQIKFVETEYLQVTSIFRPWRDQIDDADWLHRPAGANVVHLIRSLIRRQWGSRGSKRPELPDGGPREGADIT